MTAWVAGLGRGVLDVLFALGQRGWQLSAVDLSDDFCASAGRNADAHGLLLRAVMASVHETPFDDDEFDAAILSETLEHVPDELEKPTIAEAFRILRPGGTLLISVPNARSLFTRYQGWRLGASSGKRCGAQVSPRHLA